MLSDGPRTLFFHGKFTISGVCFWPKLVNLTGVGLCRWLHPRDRPIRGQSVAELRLVLSPRPDFHDFLQNMLRIYRVDSSRVVRHLKPKRSLICRVVIASSILNDFNIKVYHWRVLIFINFSGINYKKVSSLGINSSRLLPGRVHYL